MIIDWQFIIDVVKTIVVFFGLLTCVPFIVYAERRVSAFIQDRLGPNRVGPIGLFQSFADAIKLFFKEDFTPAHTDKFLFILAPALTFITPTLVFAVIPFGHSIEVGEYTINLQILDMDLGVLFVLVIASLSGYGIIFGGWASNNKYSLIGGLRSTAQMISYEIVMGLSIVALLMTVGSTNMNRIVGMQTHSFWGTFIPTWNIITQPLTFLLFIIAAFAETNRLPFDLSEADAELVAGYHTEYSSMKFAMFFMGEYVALLTMSSLIVTLFLGGWYFPGIVDPESFSLLNGILSVLVFGTKVSMVIFCFIWVRWTLPRFRYDQLMKLSWKVLIPLALFNILLTAIIGLSK